MYNFYPDFRGSEGAMIIASIGLVLVLCSLVVAPVIFERILTKCYPPFEFQGAHSHSSLARRMSAGTIVLLVVLPILMNLAAGFIKDAIYLWLR